MEELRGQRDAINLLVTVVQSHSIGEILDLLMAKSAIFQTVKQRTDSLYRPSLSSNGQTVNDQWDSESRAYKRVYSSVRGVQGSRRPRKEARMVPIVNLLDQDDLINLRDYPPLAVSLGEELQEEFSPSSTDQRFSFVTDRALDVVVPPTDNDSGKWPHPPTAPKIYQNLNSKIRQKFNQTDIFASPAGHKCENSVAEKEALEVREESLAVCEVPKSAENETRTAPSIAKDTIEFDRAVPPEKEVLEPRNIKIKKKESFDAEDDQSLKERILFLQHSVRIPDKHLSLLTLGRLISQRVQIVSLARLPQANCRLDAISWTPLFVATLFGAFEVVECLMEYDADINEVPADGFTLLHAASLSNFGNIFLGLVEYLDCDSPVARIHRVPVLSRFTVQPSSHASLLEHIVKAGLDSSAPDVLGLTPLHLACLHSTDIARNLINHNAIVSARSKLGWTPLHIAALWESDSYLAQLLVGSGADLEAPLTLPKAPRSEQSCCENDDVFGRWLTPLGLAVAKGNHSLVRRLLQMGARTQMSDPSRTNVLSIAAAMGNTSMLILLSKQGVEYRIPEIRGISIVDGVATDPTRSSQVTVKRLSRANEEGQLIEETVLSYNDRLLTFEDYLPRSMRIDIDTFDQHGDTPLLKAIKEIGNENVRMAVIARFVALGASTKIPDPDGRHVLHFSEKLQTEDIRRLFISDADLEARDNLGRTPLLELVRMGKQTTKVEYLIALGANIYAKDYQGRTAWTLLNESSDRLSKARIGRLSRSFVDLSEDSQKGELKKILNKAKKSRTPPQDWEERRWSRESR
ncbi:MAG: hypothetical protein Q9160_006465 [Pyrenula sp. 1 TL-2023]